MTRPLIMFRLSCGSLSRRASRSHDASASTLVDSAASTLALRGCWSMTDSSPKNSPLPRRATTSEPRSTLTEPLRITYRPVPTWPWRTMNWPGANSCSPATAASRSIDSALMPANSGTPASAAALSWVLSAIGRTISVAAMAARADREAAQVTDCRQAVHVYPLHVRTGRAGMKVPCQLVERGWTALRHDMNGAVALVGGPAHQ